MSNNSDWLPGSRTEQLAMAKTWIKVFSVKGESWGITESMQMDLNNKIIRAQESLDAAIASERTVSMNQRIRTDFGEMTTAMRDIKRRHLFMPPLTEEDWVSLGLKLPDAVKTEIPVPTSVASGKCLLTVAHHLTVEWEIIQASVNDPRADNKVRIYYSVVVADTAEQSSMTGKQYYLTSAPHTPEQLKEEASTRRKKHIVSFPYEDSVNTAWFCLRVENDKGQVGPWGKMFSAVIP